MRAPEPYWSDGEGLALYLGDMREVLPALGVTADCIVADPPYGETSLAWDRWPDGWVEAATGVTRSMWCFGSLRMYLEHAGEFKAARWRLSQDLIWEKGNGSGPATDRFRRVHEQPTHWYQGKWAEIYHDVPRVAATSEQIARNGRARRVRVELRQRGKYGPKAWADDGTRVMRSVMRFRSMRGLAIHPTEKPCDLLDPLVTYACPIGGLVIDPFAGSGSTLDAARASGRRAIGIEAHEPYAEAAARRLSQMVLELS